MKRVLWIITLFASLSSVYGQRSIDTLFNRYAGRDGFVTLTISGKLLKLARCLDDEKVDNWLPGDITEIRILAQEDEGINAVNFYDLVIKDIDVGNYEEFMRVKESDQDLRMLVCSQGTRFKEFLLIAGGEDNVIVQIKGNMTFQEAKKFSDHAKRNHGLNLVANHD